MCKYSQAQKYQSGQIVSISPSYILTWNNLKYSKYFRDFGIMSFTLNKSLTLHGVKQP